MYAADVAGTKLRVRSRDATSSLPVRAPRSQRFEDNVMVAYQREPVWPSGKALGL